MKREEVGVASISQLAVSAFASILFIAACVLPASAAEQTIYSFKGAPDGQAAYNGLIADKNGNLYGTTVGGGTFNFGVVFELSPGSTGWSESILYNFQGLSNSDGESPWGNLIMDAAGNLYGTTSAGGGSGSTCSPYGCGTVFELSPPSAQGGAWNEAVLYRFKDDSDGGLPYSSLIFDQSGNIYGTTRFGGTGAGAVFELTPTNGSGEWNETTLHDFGGLDGANPVGGLILGRNGVLYGTTQEGGASGAGVVYRLVQQSGVWNYHTIYSFGGASGQGPLGNLVADKSGNLYGTTNAGGASGFGTVFELILPNSGGSGLTENVLYSFQGSTDGAYPAAGVIFDTSGNLYGTTGGGEGGPEYEGTVFQLSPPTIAGGAWSESVLHLFGNPTGGTNPNAGLVFGKSGSLYGTAPTGGAKSVGVVFRIAP